MKFSQTFTSYLLMQNRVRHVGVVDCLFPQKLVDPSKSETKANKKYVLISSDISRIRRLLSFIETHIYFCYFKGEFQFRRDSWEARGCNRVSSATQCTAQQETVGVNISANQNLTAFGKLLLELWRGMWSNVISRLVCTDVTLQSSFTFWSTS